jgi:hypothetical protein
LKTRKDILEPEFAIKRGEREKEREREREKKREKESEITPVAFTRQGILKGEVSLYR